MDKKYNSMVYSLVVGVLFFGLSIFAWIKPVDQFSATERRELNQFPELSVETIFSGKFMGEFEKYTLDQFPFRDEFRSIKAFTHFYALGQSDNNDVYVANGYVSKLDYPLSSDAMDRAVKKFTSIYNTYIKGSEANVYTAWIPDKNYFLAKESGYLSYDYEEMYTYLNENLGFATYIEIRDLLFLDSYYHTDTHWKQESIQHVAQHIGNSMGVDLNAEYEPVTLGTPFYGVYYGQLALPIAPDQITYMNHESFEDCVIINHESGKEIPMYNMELAVGRDPYEMYLSGSLSVITIENPNATTDKELVIFRDSFGSSIAPYFVEGYSKITILDARYLNEMMIGKSVEFTNQDVLFLYSTGVLNNPTAF